LAIINFDLDTGKFEAENVIENVESVLMPIDFIQKSGCENIKMVKSSYRAIFGSD